MKKVFVSYSHKDEKKKKEVMTYLKTLERVGRFKTWDDKEIKTGSNWFPAIEKELNTSDIIIMLISANFLTSDFILNKEVACALQRREQGDAIVIPVLLSHCPWKNIEWLSSMQLFPRDGKPLNMFKLADRQGQLTELAKLVNALCNDEDATATEMVQEKKKISLSKLPTTDNLLIGRKKELEMLSEAWEDEHTHIISFVAWGGVGKTALVNYWLNLMERNHYCGAARVYGWSFYSQGAREGSQASADEFLQETLEWFGDKDPMAGSTEKKWQRLVELVRQQKTLLILDGVEPLQYPPGEIPGFEGRFKDAGMKMFLKELAASMKGLCVITTREGLSELSEKEGFTFKQEELEHLSNEAGCELLKKKGIDGADKEISKAVTEYAGHALALTLLGNFLKVRHHGDIRKRDCIKILEADRYKGGHAKKVMEAYEKWLKGTAELNILYIMGLFDRPVPVGALEALRKEPVIDGITDKLINIPDNDYHFAFNRLQSLNLLSFSFKSCKSNNPANPGSDSHPLIREYFGERLQAENPKAWKAAHLRLYEYYKALPEKDLPDTLEEMEPLFAAVAHGCRAGKHQEALDDIYWKMICRGEDAFVNNKLGAFGSDVAAISNFFKEPWRQPLEEFSPGDKAWILNIAGFALRALGRLREATQPLEACLEMNEKDENWEHGAINASNLSELLLTLGDVKSSVSAARQAVTHADKSEQWDQMMKRRTTLADALHQWGSLEEAEQTFREAEALQKERQPEYPYLYSQRGYKYCDLLLGRGAAAIPEVRKRMEALLKWRLPGDSLLDISLENLTTGRAWMMMAETENKKHFSNAMKFLDDAVEGLRGAGYQEMLIRGLLARAECYRLQKMLGKAWDDLNEAKEIAELGEMKLHLVDYCIIAGKTFKSAGKLKEARECFEEGLRIVEETEYFRRGKEIKDLIVNGQ